LGPGRLGYAEQALLVGSSLVSIILIPLVYVQPRFLFFPLAGGLLGLAALVDLGWERRRRWSGRVILLVVGVALLASLPPLLRGARSVEGIRQWGGYEKLAAWLSAQQLPAGAVMEGRETLSYRMRVPHVFLWEGSVGGTVRYALARRVKYIAVSTDSYPTELRHTLLTAERLPGLERLVVIEEDGNRAVLWQVMTSAEP